MKVKVSRHQRHADSNDPRDHQPGAPGIEQKHNYTPSKSYNPPQNEHEQAVFEGKGEYGQRTRSANPAVTGGHHVTSRSGAEQSEERRQHVLANRKATEAIFDSHRRHTSAKPRKNEANADCLPK